MKITEKQPQIQSRSSISWLDYPERFLMLSVLLGFFGVLMVYSASATFSRNALNSDSFFFIRQFVFYIIALLGCYIAIRSPSYLLEKYAFLLIGLSFVLLVLVLVPGIGELKYGARRWIRFMSFGIQPSEVFKFAAVVWAASFFKRKKLLLESFFQGVVPVLLLLGLAAFLFLLQPDFGNFVLIAMTLFIMGFYAGYKWQHLLLVAVAFVAGATFAILNNPYRLQRINSYLDPWADPYDTGFQLINSIIAFGSGGLFGKGLGNSLQKQYYLPFPQTDFIFATIGEELGLLSTVCLILVFILWLHSGFKIADRCQESFCRYFIFGICVLIGNQILLHIGVVLGVLPTKGIGLPFISYGGSSLVVYFFAVGWVVNLGNKDRLKPNTKQEQPML